MSHTLHKVILSTSCLIYTDISTRGLFVLPGVLGKATAKILQRVSGDGSGGAVIYRVAEMVSVYLQRYNMQVGYVHITWWFRASASSYLTAVCSTLHTETETWPLQSMVINNSAFVERKKKFLQMENPKICVHDVTHNTSRERLNLGFAVSYYFKLCHKYMSNRTRKRTYPVTTIGVLESPVYRKQLCQRQLLHVRPVYSPGTGL